MISIYGLKDAVRKAVVSLQKAIGLRVAEPTDVLSLEENWACPSGLSVAEENRGQAATEGAESSQPHVPVPPQATWPQSKDMPDHLNSAAGQGTQHGRPPGRFKQQPSLVQANAACCRSGHLQCCPTCGAARFCTECGAPAGNHGLQDALPTPAANKVHWQQQRQSQQLPLPAGRKGRRPDNHHGGGARAGMVEMDPQTVPWMPPQMVVVPYDGTMAMQGAAAHCGPGMLPVAFASMDQWFAATGPGHMDTQVFMAPTTMFAGHSAPVDANTISPQSSDCRHPSEESLPSPERSNDSLPPMH